MSQKLHVRLKPHNPRRGHVLQRYSYRGIRFYEGRWYKVPRALAQELSVIHQKHNDEDSPYAFDVATEKQAHALEDRERRKREEELRRVRNADVVSAADIRDGDIRGAMTTADLPRMDRVDRLPPEEDPFEEVADSEPTPVPAAREGADERPLGVDMRNTKAELLDAAEVLGVKVDESMTKADILDALEASAAR